MSQNRHPLEEARFGGHLQQPPLRAMKTSEAQVDGSGSWGVKRAGRATNFRSWAMERLAGFTGALAGAAVTGYSSEFYAWASPAVMLIVVLWDAKRMLYDPIPPEVSDAV